MMLALATTLLTASATPTLEALTITYVNNSSVGPSQIAAPHLRWALAICSQTYNFCPFD